MLALLLSSSRRACRPVPHGETGSHTLPPFPPGRTATSLGKHCSVARQGTTVRGSLLSRVAWPGLCLNTARARQSERLPWASLPGQSSWGCDAASGFQGAGQGRGARGHRSRAGASGHSEEPKSPPERGRGLARAGMSGGSQSPSPAESQHLRAVQ